MYLPQARNDPGVLLVFHPYDSRARDPSFRA